MRVYKLTDRTGRTYGGTQWGPGVRHAASSKDRDLCTDGWIHAYESAELAVLLNPIHGDFKRPRLWLAEGHGRPTRDGQLKLGFRALTTLTEMAPPKYTTKQRVAFGIYCAQPVTVDGAWHEWADGWLSGRDRERSAAAWTWAAGEAAAWAEAAAAARAAEAAEAAALAAARAAAAARARAPRKTVDLQACALRALEYDGGSR